jgi:hypothetical protein
VPEGDGAAVLFEPDTPVLPRASVNKIEEAMRIVVDLIEIRTRVLRAPTSRKEYAPSSRTDTAPARTAAGAAARRPRTAVAETMVKNDRIEKTTNW